MSRVMYLLGSLVITLKKVYLIYSLLKASKAGLLKFKKKWIKFEGKGESFLKCMEGGGLKT